VVSYEPSSLEILFSVITGQLLAAVYRDYIDRLNLHGNERVMDFGSGGGTLARIVAERLLVGGGTLTCVDISERWMRLLQRRLKHFPNVRYYHLGHFSELSPSAQSQDIVLVHFVLHLIPPEERDDVMRHLAGQLIRNGRLCVREPTAQISLEEIDRHAMAAHLVQIEAAISRMPLMGETYEVVYCKPV